MQKPNESNDRFNIQTLNMIVSNIWSKHCETQTLKLQKQAFSILRYRSKSIEIGKKSVHIHILEFDNIPSTMVLSGEWPREFVDHQNLFAFVANSQSSGVGQMTNIWMSPPGNVYLTILAQVELQNLIYLPMATLSCIINFIQGELETETQKKVIQCKWVNDIFANQKKLSGVLIRSSNSNGKFFVEFGIGINIKKCPLETSTCLEEITQKQVNLEIFRQNFILNFSKSISNIDSPHYQKIIKEYESHLMFKDEIVNIFDEKLTNILWTGVFKGITNEGYAILQTKEGIVNVDDGRMRGNIVETQPKLISNQQRMQML